MIIDSRGRDGRRSLPTKRPHIEYFWTNWTQACYTGRLALQHSDTAESKGRWTITIDSKQIAWALIKNEWQEGSRIQNTKCSPLTWYVQKHIRQTPVTT